MGVGDDVTESKSQRKRAALAVQDLADRLCALSAAELDTIPLDDELRGEVVAGRSLTKGAYRRHVRFLAGRLRATDVEPVRDALARLGAASHADRARHHRLERWRERLMAEGDAALEALVEDYPRLDRQALRGLVRRARRERETGAAPQAYRQLFRFLRELEAA